MRIDITQKRDAATYVRIALKLQDTYAVFLRESGTWKANAQRQLGAVDGLVHTHIMTSFLGAFWSGENFVPWLVVNHDKRPLPLAKYREALFNGTFTYEAYSHIYLLTVVTLRKHVQLSHVVNCLVSRYMEAEVFQYLETINTLKFDKKSTFAHQLYSLNVTFQNKLNERLAHISEWSKHVSDLFTEVDIRAELFAVIHNLFLMLSHPAKDPEFVPFGRVWTNETSATTPLTIATGDVTVYKIHDGLYECEGPFHPDYAFSSIPTLPDSTVCIEASDKRIVKPVVQQFSFHDETHTQLIRACAHARTVFEEYETSAEKAAMELSRAKETKAITQTRPRKSKKKTKSMVDVCVVVPDKPSASTSQPPGTTPSDVDAPAEVTDAGDGPPEHPVLLQLREIFGSGVSVDTTVPGRVVTYPVLVPYGSSMYSDAVSDIDVFFISNKPFSTTPIFRSLETHSHVTRIQDGQYTIRGNKVMPYIDLHERSQTRENDDWMQHVTKTMDIHDRTLQRMQDERAKEMYVTNKEAAKDGGIYDSKYLMLRGVAIAHIDGELSNWLKWNDAITVDQHVVYEPLSHIRQGMLKKIAGTRPGLTIEFDFRYEVPGVHFRPFIKLLNIISGNWLHRGVYKNVTGHFVPSASDDGKMTLLFWESNVYTRTTVSEIAGQLAIPLTQRETP